MTIPNTARKAGPLLGTGSQTAWPFTFKVFTQSDVAVSVTNALGVVTVLVLGTDYTVTLNSNQDTSPGGTVNYPISGAALPVGSALAIIGDLDYDQALDLPSGGNFSPLALENQLDRATMQIQQLKELSDRSARMSVFSSPEDVEALTSGIIALAAVDEDIAALSGSAADIATVADSVGSVNTVADSIGAVNSVADNLSLWRDVTAGNDIQITNFNGTGAQVAFTLPFSPGVENNTQVFIGGVYQQKNTYSLSGTTLTFGVAPPSGTANIEVVWSRPFVLGATDAALVSFVQAGAGAGVRTSQDKMRETVSVKDFGAIGGGVINDTTAFNAAIAFCKLMGKGLKIPDDTYLLTAGAVNFAGQGLAIVGEGKPTLQFTGTGRAFEMDTLLSNGSVFSDMRVENLRIVGGPSITDGFYSRGIVRSVFRNIVVRECSAKAFHILHGVSNQYDSLKYSANEGAQITRPAYGVYITNNGAGYYTADCTFINCISEDFSLGVGCYVHDGGGNVFVGGTFEGCNVGLAIGEGCRRNHFISLWCEVNGSRDIEVNSTANTFDDCYFGSSSSGPNVEVGTGKGTVFRGGYIRTANLQSASSDTLFIGCGFDRNLSGTLGITGTGTYRVFSATKIDNSGNVVGNMDDKLGTVNGLTLSKGITFPATQVASSDANTLDDYEEGTWTGSLAAGTSGTITMNSGLRTGSYIKIGRVVTVSGVFYVDSVSSPVGELSLTGLPFPANSGSSSSRAAAAVWASGLQATATTQIMGRIVSGESEIKLQKFASGSLSAMAADVKADSQFYISLTYVTNV